MAQFFVRRALYLVPVLLVLSVVAFGLIELTPGDPARILLQQRIGEMPTDAAVDRFRHEQGLDAPLAVRYATWLGDVLQGDLGTSLRTGEPVLDELSHRFVRTLQLAIPAFLLGLIISLPLGIAAAAHRNRLTDHASRVMALLGASLPTFWLAYMLIVVVAVRAELLPVSGYGGLAHMALPVAALLVGGAASLMRLTRASMLEALHTPHVLAERAAGLPQRTILRRALKNALIPIVTLASLRFGFLLGGTVIVEVIFSWPGLGKYVVDSIFSRDLPSIQGFVLFIGTVFVLINLLTDAAYVYLDPRIRLGGRPEVHGGA